jgi:hypothetical protein
MYTSLNRTITKLTNTAKIAEEKDKQQMERISILEIQVSNLTAAVTNVIASVESLNSQLVERHLVLMAVELVVFLLIFVYTVSRVRTTTARPLSQTSSMTTSETWKSLMPVNDLTPSRGTSCDHMIGSGSSRHRRLSMDQVRRRRQADDKRELLKSGSENDLTAIEQDIPIFLINSDGQSAATAEFQKRQRKKKKCQAAKHQLHHSISTGQLRKTSHMTQCCSDVTSRGPSINQSVSVSHGSAGLMFTTATGSSHGTTAAAACRQHQPFVETRDYSGYDQQWPQSGYHNGISLNGHRQSFNGAKEVTFAGDRFLSSVCNGVKPQRSAVSRKNSNSLAVVLKDSTNSAGRQAIS